MEKMIRFGAIGCGSAGTNRINQLAKHELGVKVVAAVDVEPWMLQNLEKVLGYSDFAHYTGEQDFKRMMDENELDAVGIFTPHSLHLPHVQYAIKKNLSILIEKPMVCGAANALDVTEQVEAKKLIGIVHYQRHFELKYMKAKELIEKGAIGKVTNFFVYMAQDWVGRTWRGVPKFCCGGQINDSGSHYQDIILWMLNELPVSAQGFTDSFYHGEQKQGEYNGMFNVELTNGITGRFVILSDIPGGFVDDVRICGTKGNLFFNGDKLIMQDAATKEYTEIPLSRPKGYPISPCDNFVKLIRKKVKINRVPFIFGSRVSLLTEAMLRSGRAKGKKILCEDILKECGHSLDDLK